MLLKNLFYGCGSIKFMGECFSCGVRLTKAEVQTKFLFKKTYNTTVMAEFMIVEEQIDV